MKMLAEDEVCLQVGMHFQVRMHFQVGMPLQFGVFRYLDIKVKEITTYRHFLTVHLRLGKSKIY